MSFVKDTLEQIREIVQICEQEDANDHQLLQDMLEGETNVELLMNWIVDKVAEDQANVLATKHRIEKLQARVKSRQNSTDSLKNLFFSLLKQTKETKFKNDVCTVSIRKGTSKLNIKDETEVPELYKSYKASIDKKALKEAIENNVTVKGAFLEDGKETISFRF